VNAIDLRSARPWQIDAAGAAALVVMTVLLYVLGIGPIFRRHAEQGSRQAELDAEFAKADRLEQTQVSLGEQVARVRKAVAECKLELKPAAHANRRIAAISALAAETGLTIDDIQPGVVASGARYRMVPITLAGKGTYVTCVTFLHRLHEAYPDTGLASMVLQNASEDPAGPPAARFRFELLWYAAPASASSS